MKLKEQNDRKINALIKIAKQKDKQRKNNIKVKIHQSIKYFTNFIILILYLCLIMGFFMGTIFTMKVYVDLQKEIVLLSVIGNFIAMIGCSYEFVKLSNKM